MKKTLIALAVAASAAVSGSAMAWTQQDSSYNGNIELGGVLQPETKKLPWELQVGTGSNQLNGVITKGATKATIKLTDAIPVLGMRTVNGGFSGAEGLTPQIDYKGAINVDSFASGVTKMNLSVTDEAGNRIGSLSTDFSTGAFGANNTHRSSLYAGKAGAAFWGGIGKTAAQVVNTVAALESVATSLFPTILDTRGDMGNLVNTHPGEYYFTAPNHKYRSIYYSGIVAGKTISISLDTPADTDNITWKASLPVTVSYQ
ncbi:fimbrial protein [Escherichia coli]|uniref:F4 family fimbrial subunit n=1 Tax=Escherichia coli TaxID=562 RepID=UPI0013023EE1|nr:fimbrial protein [Escherichia coli]KAE9932478.1 fimbrial protein [Escherichia coli]MWK27275.1 fimbrial protein [Escherichia coli]